MENENQDYIIHNKDLFNFKYDNFYNVIVIGGGPAGLAAANEAKNHTKKVALIERESKLGGILKQCIHDGFGIVKFNKKLTGPEYANIFINYIKNSKVKIFKETFVLDIEKINSEKITNETNFKLPENIFKITVVNKRENIFTLFSSSLIIATGCRERTAKQIFLHGTRPAGIYTAGLAQYFINIQGYLPGKNIVILGSGDIGLIMARRLTLEGANVLGVYEIKHEPSGLTRNIVQCLNDFNIPLFTGKTVTKVHGEYRVEGVTICDVNNKLEIIPDTEQFVKCDTLILSVGLIPENDILDTLNIQLSPITKGPIVDQTLMTEIPGLFSCGNSLHVNDLVDYVSESAEIAGYWAAKYANYCILSEQNNTDKNNNYRTINIKFSDNLLYVVPQKINLNIKGNFPFYFRSKYTFYNKTFVITDSFKNIILKKKYIKLKPPEMEKIEVNIDKLNKKIDSIYFDILD